MSVAGSAADVARLPVDIALLIPGGNPWFNTRAVLAWRHTSCMVILFVD
jgi:hypothetical protein